MGMPLHKRAMLQAHWDGQPIGSAIAGVTAKANASNVIRLINENVIFFDNIRFISLFLWNKIFKLKPKNLAEGKKRKK